MHGALHIYGLSIYGSCTRTHFQEVTNVSDSIIELAGPILCFREGEDRGSCKTPICSWKKSKQQQFVEMF